MIFYVRKYEHMMETIPGLIGFYVLKGWKRKALGLRAVLGAWAASDTGHAKISPRRWLQYLALASVRTTDYAVWQPITKGARYPCHISRNSNRPRVAAYTEGFNLVSQTPTTDVKVKIMSTHSESSGIYGLMLPIRENVKHGESNKAEFDIFALQIWGQRVDYKAQRTQTVNDIQAKISSLAERKTISFWETEEWPNVWRAGGWPFGGWIQGAKSDSERRSQDGGNSGTT